MLSEAPRLLIFLRTSRAWYNLRNMLQNVEHALFILFLIVMLVAFRLLFGHPAFQVMFRYLPKRWQQWLFSEPQSSAKTKLRSS